MNWWVPSYHLGSGRYSCGTSWPSLSWEDTNVAAEQPVSGCDWDWAVCVCVCGEREREGGRRVLGCVRKALKPFKMMHPASITTPLNIPQLPNGQYHRGSINNLLFWNYTSLEWYTTWPLTKPHLSCENIQLTPQPLPICMGIGMGGGEQNWGRSLFKSDGFPETSSQLVYQFSLHL